MARKDAVYIYKPSRNLDKGAALQLKIGSERDCLFLELTKQMAPMGGAKVFDWKNLIRVKLGESDIGKLIALFSGTWPMSDDPKKPDLELFHKTAKGSKVIRVKKQDNGYYIKVSAKEGGQLSAVGIGVSIDEAELVKVALNKGYEVMLGW